MRDPKDIKILIVDDEPDIAELLGYDFEKLNFKVFTATDGKMAFEIALKEKIDIVVSDIRMPGGDGITLLDKLKKVNIEIPVVLFLSGHHDITDRKSTRLNSSHL